MDAARNGNRRIPPATRINRIHPVAPGPRRRGPLIMSTPHPGSARVTDALLTGRKGAVARLRLHRPELHNAFDAALIAALTAALEQLAGDDDVRVVVLEGAGASFSAGADLNWMRGMAAAGEQENRADALALARLMRVLDELPKPTIARIHGAAFGGGVGLVACCDIAIGPEGAKFGLTESRLGLLPAVRSEEHTSELQSLMRISYAVFCLKKKKKHPNHNTPTQSEILIQKKVNHNKI